MAYSPKYITVAGAGAHDGSNEANAWTLAEAIAGYSLGDAMKMKAGAYSIGALTLATAGTAAQYIPWQGYNSVADDLQTQGRNADTSLDTTNFPVITVTGQITMAAYNFFINITITGALSSEIIFSTSIDFYGFLSCLLRNTQNNASAAVMRCDDNIVLINNDIECTGASHGIVCRLDDKGTVVGNRFLATAVSSTLFYARNFTLVKNAFIGPSSALAINLWQIEPNVLIMENTCYGVDTFLQTPNSAALAHIILIDNHITDNTTYLYNPYQATGLVAILEMFNRTRDNTTPRSGIGDGINIGEITADTGGPSTDYVDAPNGNYRLITGAAGLESGLIKYSDIGMFQKEPTGGGGGGSPLIVGLNSNRIGIQEV